ncbi:MAG: pirin family protein [Microcystaceae cyanobacterium]
MITIRSSSQRGQANFGWLDSKHTFSFGSYYDPNHISFGNLRVINEDKVQPSKGFGPHSHQNMEIITYVLSGKLEHKDSIGNGSIIRPGDIQRMSAGTGITHSEFNASGTELVHFLQIWIIPNQKGVKPSYAQKHFSREEKQGKLTLVASSEGRDNSVKIHQNTDLFVSLLKEGDQLNHKLKPNRSAWLQIAKGAVEIEGKTLLQGDGAGISQVSDIQFTAIADETEILLFDLA